MKRHFKTLVMLMTCIAMVLCVSCKKGNNEPIVDGIGALGYSNSTINGHEYVDLKLPSGTLWATCNIGAKDPFECGDYFAWGETKAKNTYDWGTYTLCKGTATSFTKYNDDSNYGTVDKKTVLDPEDDAVNMNWGGGWRMPTPVEMKELKKNCKWTWTAFKGSEGYLVTGPNGNSIFLPAAGYRFGTRLTGTQGFYWTNALYPSNSSNAYSLFFDSSSVNPDGVYPRFRGYTIRPVCSKKE